MAWIRVITEACTVELHRAVEDSDCFITVRSFSKVPLDLELKHSIEPLTILSESFAGAESCDIVAMDGDYHLEKSYLRSAFCLSGSVSAWDRSSCTESTGETSLSQRAPCFRYEDRLSALWRCISSSLDSG